MRAEFLYLDVQFTHQVVRLTPVAVCGIHDDCLRHNGYGQELAVRRVKRVLWQFLEPTPVVLRRRDRESAYSDSLILAVVYVLEQCVPDAGRAREAEVGSVLIEDSTTVVHCNDSIRHSALEPLHASQLARRVDIRVAVGRDADVGVDNDRAHPDCSAILLLKPALAIAATSPTSSPKKPSGQFSTSP